MGYYQGVKASQGRGVSEQDFPGQRSGSTAQVGLAEGRKEGGRSGRKADDGWTPLFVCGVYGIFLDMTVAA